MDPAASLTEAVQALTAVANQMAVALHTLNTSRATGGIHHIINVAKDQQPQVFHGKTTECPEEWLEKFQSIAVINNWPGDTFVARAKPMLEEAAWRWYKEIIADTPVTWPEFSALLLKHFKLSSTEVAQMLLLRYQSKKESVQELADAMKQLFREGGIPEAMQILQFAQKLQPELSHRVMDRQCTTLEQAVLSAAQYEANDNYMKDRQSPHRTSNMQRFADTSQYNNVAYEFMPSAPLVMPHDTALPMEVGFARKNNTASKWSNQYFDGNFNGDCNKCGEYGHKERDCKSMNVINHFEDSSGDVTQLHAHSVERNSSSLLAKEAAQEFGWASAWRADDINDDNDVAYTAVKLILPDNDFDVYPPPPVDSQKLQIPGETKLPTSKRSFIQLNDFGINSPDYCCKFGASYQTSPEVSKLPNNPSKKQICNDTDVLVNACMEVLRNDPAAQAAVNREIHRMKEAAQIKTIEEKARKSEFSLTHSTDLIKSR